MFIAIKTEAQKNKVLNCESTCKKCVRERKTLGEFKVVWGVIKGTIRGRSRKKKSHKVFLAVMSAGLKDC